MKKKEKATKKPTHNRKKTSPPARRTSDLQKTPSNLKKEKKKRVSEGNGAVRASHEKNRWGKTDNSREGHFESGF